MSKTEYRQREHARSIVEIEAQCLIVAGFSADVVITDISPGGCQLRAKQGYLTRGWSVGIQFAGMNILRGTVCWTTENTVGRRAVRQGVVDRHPEAPA